MSQHSCESALCTTWSSHSCDKSCQLVPVLIHISNTLDVHHVYMLCLQKQRCLSNQHKHTHREKERRGDVEQAERGGSLFKQTVTILMTHTNWTTFHPLHRDIILSHNLHPPFMQTILHNGQLCCSRLYSNLLCAGVHTFLFNVLQLTLCFHTPCLTFRVRAS